MKETMDVEELIGGEEARINGAPEGRKKPGFFKKLAKYFAYGFGAGVSFGGLGRISGLLDPGGIELVINASFPPAHFTGLKVIGKKPEILRDSALMIGYASGLSAVYADKVYQFLSDLF